MRRITTKVIGLIIIMGLIGYLIYGITADLSFVQVKLREVDPFSMGIPEIFWKSILLMILRLFGIFSLVFIAERLL